jgi:hypothetical protein
MAALYGCVEMKLESTLVGVAGEYFVAAELSVRGCIASITLRNSRGIDIIVSNADGTKSVTIQVKTNSSGDSSWILNKKSEDYLSSNHYYVFVSLKPLGLRPEYYIVPSEIVARYCRETHRKWLSGFKKDGSSRQDSNMRKFKDESRKYLEAWDLIKL